MIVNTKKGRSLFEKTEELAIKAVAIEDAVERNEQLTHPSSLQNKRQERLQDYEEKSGKEIEALYFRNDRKSVLKGKIKKLIPYRFKVLIRRRGL